MFQFLIRQILIKHQQIISEIQKSLSRILFFQRSPSYMIYHTLRNTDKLFSPTAQTPAQVNFFHVGKKMTIQTSNFTIISQPDKKSGPRYPHHLRYRIILSAILLNNIKNTSSAKRISIPVDKSPRRSGIFKIFLIMPT